MRSEKVSVKLSLTELGPIDYLVEKGIYESRSDFIRLAVKRQTEQHAGDIEEFLHPPYLAGADRSKERIFGGVGIMKLDKSTVESLISMNTRLKIRLLGILVIDKAITVEQILTVVASIEVYGKLIAEREIIEALSEAGYRA